MQHLIFIPSAVWIKKTTNTLSLAYGWDGIDCGFVSWRESLISLSTISSVYLHLVRVSLFQLHRLITIILDNFSQLPFTNGPKCHKCIKCNLHVSTGQQNRLVSPNISKNKERSRIQPPKKRDDFYKQLCFKMFLQKMTISFEELGEIRDYFFPRKKLSHLFKVMKITV